MVEDRQLSTPPVIGLAGGIGAGKSTLAGILHSLGCFVSDADQLARAVLEEEDVQSTIRGWWGPEMLGEAGKIDRTALGTKVFSDVTALRKLEGLLHPRIEAARAAAFAAAGTPRAFVIDAPLLFETGLDEACDAIIYLETPQSVRIERVRARGWDEEELLRRERLQWALDRKRERADHVLTNDGSQAVLSERTRNLLDSIAPQS